MSVCKQPLNICSSHHIHIRKWKHLALVIIHSDFKIWKKKKNLILIFQTLLSDFFCLKITTTPTNNGNGNSKAVLSSLTCAGH